MKIWHYELNLRGETVIPFNILARKAIHVGMRQGKPTVWLEVITDNWQMGKEYQTKLKVFATGEEISDKYSRHWDHIGTIQDGDLFWHVYGEKKIYIDNP